MQLRTTRAATILWIAWTKWNRYGESPSTTQVKHPKSKRRSTSYIMIAGFNDSRMPFWTSKLDSSDLISEIKTSPIIWTMNISAVCKLSINWNSSLIQNYRSSYSDALPFENLVFLIFSILHRLFIILNPLLNSRIVPFCSSSSSPIVVHSKSHVKSHLHTP